MVEYQVQLDSLFGALSDPTRRAIVASLATGPRTVGQLAEPFEMSLAAVSKHVDVLGQAGLVQRRRRGRFVECTLDVQRLRPVSDWIGNYEQFWGDRINRLEAVIREKRRNAT